MQPAFAMRFPGTLEDFERAFTAFRRALDGEQMGAAARYDAELVFEEIVANIVRYGATDGRSVDVRLTLDLGPDSIRLTFDDDGVAFDPRVPAGPPPRSRHGQGGFGLMLVQRAASSLDYLRTPEGRNRLTVTLPRGAVAGGRPVDARPP
jgi:anti-sigma regulatory factor (Ser/Thr protein kinase)